MKRSKLLIGVMLAMVTTVPAQKKWTLQECIDYALEHNITLKKSQLRKESATEDLKGAKAALFPTLNASTNQSLGYRPWQESGTQLVTNGEVNAKVDKAYYNGSYSLSSQWTLWNGKRNVNTVKLDRLAEQEAELQVEESANSIQQSIARVYSQILYTDESVKVMEEVAETSRKNEQRGREMVEVGSMSKADLAQLTSQRATDEYNLVVAQTNLAKYKLQLKQLLEITGEEAFDIAMPSASDQQALADIPALGSVYEQALLQRPEIKNAKLGIEASDIQLKIARAGHMPTVSLSGGVSTNSSSNNSKDWNKQIKTNFDAAAGVNVSIPIFDNRKARTAIRKARIQQEQAQLTLQSNQKTLYKAIESYWLEAVSNQQKFRAAQATVASQQTSYDLLSEQFQLGLKNVVELMTGKANLLKAQQNRLQSKYTTILNQQLLRFYEGEPMNI